MIPSNIDIKHTGVLVTLYCDSSEQAAAVAESLRPERGKKPIDCGLKLDLQDGTCLLIVHYAGESKLDMFLANRVQTTRILGGEVEES